MTRILQAIAGATFGGAEAFFVRLVLALHRVGVEQRIIIRAHARRAEVLRAGGLLPVELPFDGPLDIKSRFCFRREIMRFQPEIVLTWMNRATRFCPHGRFIHVGRLGGYYNLKYYRHCNYIISNTHGIADYVVQQGWPQERVYYLPNFVSGVRHSPLNRGIYNTPDCVPLVLAIGRLHENKGFDILLKAITYLPDVHLWIAGEGIQRASLEALAVRLTVKSRVRFLGWREDIASLLATADLFVCSSRHEPLGNVVLEAWAQHLPVVATASEGPTSLIHTGKNGILTPVNEVLALAQAIRHVLQDSTLRQRIATGGHQSFEANFTEVKVVACYQAFFDKISALCAVSAGL